MTDLFILCTFGFILGYYLSLISSDYLTYKECKGGNKLISLTYLSREMLAKHSGIIRKASLKNLVQSIIFILLWVSAFSSNPHIAYQKTPLIIHSLASISLVTILFTIAIIDLKYKHIPECLYRSGLVLGLLVTGINGYFLSSFKGFFLIFDHLIAIALFQICFQLIRRFTSNFVGYETIGMGDAKLASMGGAWLGFQDGAVSLAFSFIAAGIFSTYGFISGKLKPGQSFAFGPYLNTGIWIMWLFESSWLWKQWFNLLGLKYS